MTMKLAATVPTIILLVAACGGSGQDIDGDGSGLADGVTSSTTATPSSEVTDPPAPAADTAEVMAAAIHQLVTVDHTFGSGPPPFTEYLVQERLDPSAGTATGGGEALRPLTEAERAAIEAVVAPLGPIRFVADPDDWRTPELTPTIEGAVILGVGEPEIDGDTATVPVSLWCGGVCGTWLTYALERTDTGWTVTGYEGPIAIS